MPKKARPNQYLVEHLRSVEEIMLQSKTFVDKNILSLVGKSHDLGKYTKYFQDKLEDPAGKNHPYSSHSEISAIIAYIWLKEVMPTVSNEELLLSYLTVRHHHGFPNIYQQESYWFSPINLKSVNKQARNLIEEFTTIDIFSNKEEKDRLFSILKRIEKITRNLNYKNELEFKELEQTVSSFRRNKKDYFWYFYFLNLFSNLIYADKADSAGVLKKAKTFDSSPESIDKYVIRKHGKPRPKQEEVKNAVLNTLKNHKIEDTYFYTLTAPTGIGKTLTSLQAALYIKKRCGSSRIIYAVPFINIIEQSKNDYKNIFEDIVCHYSFSGIENYQDTSLNIDQALVEIESWEDNIILTTFVQLFHTIIKPSNSSAKKIKNLYNSIIILDEIQSIPEHYKAFIGTMIYFLAKHYKVRFILMTATQPKILEYAIKAGVVEEEIQVLELLPNYKKYFKEQKVRTRLIFHGEPISGDEFCDKIISNHPPETNKQSILIVVNTIRRSKEVFNRLKDEYKNVEYLSTSLISVDRRKVIDKVRKLLKKNEPVILVSTQSIEAGVDVSFDIGYRDIAPWESLVQVAGRINREGNNPTCEVHIVRLGDKDKREDWRIYTDYSIYQVIKIFENNSNIINESKYQEITEQYYEKMLSEAVRDEELNYIEAIKTFNFKKLREFSLIKDIPKNDVFVEIGESPKFLDAYIETLKESPDEKIVNQAFKIPISLASSYARKATRKLLLQEMSKYIVQTNEELPHISNRSSLLKNLNLYWVSPFQVDDFYDEHTGIKDNCSYFW
jgi:CRISPR-associated endonuclease/helicase Cas3